MNCPGPFVAVSYWYIVRKTLYAPARAIKRTVHDTGHVFYRVIHRSFRYGNHRLIHGLVHRENRTAVSVVSARYRRTRYAGCHPAVIALMRTVYQLLLGCGLFWRSFVGGVAVWRERGSQPLTQFVEP